MSRHALLRTSESKDHEKIYDFSAVLNLKFPTGLAARPWEFQIRRTGDKGDST
jgi:hypothetical protein